MILKIRRIAYNGVACHGSLSALITVSELSPCEGLTRVSGVTAGSASTEHITHGRRSVIATLLLIRGPLDTSQVVALIAGLGAFTFCPLSPEVMTLFL